MNLTVFNIKILGDLNTFKYVLWPNNHTKWFKPGVIPKSLGGYVI